MCGRTAGGDERAWDEVEVEVEKLRNHTAICLSAEADIADRGWQHDYLSILGGSLVHKQAAAE